LSDRAIFFHENHVPGGHILFCRIDKRKAALAERRFITTVSGQEI